MGYRLTGLSGFGFGVDWEKTKTDREVVRRVVNFLEDRRLLFGRRHMEDELHCVASAIEIRHFITSTLPETREGSGANASLRRIRAASRRFVEAAGPDGSFGSERSWGNDAFFLALGDLRTAVGYELGIMLDQFPTVPIEDELLSILPQPDLDEPTDQDLSWLPGTPE